MKAKIHPKFQKAVATCDCGETFETGSVLKDIKVEICSKCHPYFTGKQKFIDTEGRVDKFQKKLNIAKKMKADKEKKSEE